MDITLENQWLCLVLDSHGRLCQCLDRTTGRNRASLQTFARVKKGGQYCDVSAAVQKEGKLHLEFGRAAARAVLKVEPREHCIVFAVEACSGEGVEELTFIDVHLDPVPAAEQPLAACLLALNLQTRVDELPGANQVLRARCYERFGFAGASAALVGCPGENMRPILQQVVAGELEMPHSTIGGPWALDAPINSGSYLFNFTDLTEANADAWIALIQDLGFRQLDFHGGRSFRFGDCRPDPDLYPRGFDSLKAVIDRLHAAGIAAGLHTYAFFLHKSCPWVTPVPDDRLGKDATFALASPLAAEDLDVEVEESTAAMSTTTGFFVRNSVTLQIDEELIVYTGVRRAPPWGFTGCQRGALGTRAAAHARGARVHHLKECFGLFAPDPDTSLLGEVAQRTADAFNYCGFDMIYLDALDGEDILGGAEHGWHYGSKFAMELWKRLHRPALMEMSTFHHHLWYVRSRMGAWDHPRRSHKRFVDIHCQANENCARMFLPANLGWWSVKTWAGAQGEPTFPDDIEYLCGKALGHGSSLSLMGIDPGNAPAVPALRRLATLFRDYETLRHSGQVSAAMKARLRARGAEYALEKTATGLPRFRPVHYARQRVECLEEWGRVWTAHNPFAAQVPMLRIEALMGVGPYGGAGHVRLAGPEEAGAFSERQLAEGMHMELDLSQEQVRIGERSLRLSASSARPQRRGSWAKCGRTLSPPLDLSARQGMGFWLRGDGRGAVLNVQLRSPHHLSHAIGEHYVLVDFEGWRYLELVEPEGERYADYEWPYGSPYAIYRESIDYRQVGFVDLWLNNVPAGDPVCLFFSPLQALPLVEVELEHPSVEIAGRRVVFPVLLKSGQYLEFRGMDACGHYGSQGELLREVRPEGEAPVLGEGDNRMEFNCAGTGEGHPRARARVTVGSQGAGESI